MPLYVIVQVLLDYAQVWFNVKQYKRTISTLDKYIEQHICQLESKLRWKYSDTKYHSDFSRGYSVVDLKAKLYLSRLQETMAKYYMMRKMYDSAAEMYFKSI